MNKIAERQNAIKYLILQYSARCHYNCAEALNITIWGICLLQVVMTNLGLHKYAVLPVIISTILLEKLVTRKIKIASASRMLIDYNLFGFETKNHYKGYSEGYLCEIAIKIKNRKRRKAVLQLSNTGSDSPPGVKDWYSGVCSNANKNDAILECLSENIWWDKNLSSRYIIIAIIMLVSFAVIVLITSFEGTVKDLVSFLASISPILIKVIIEILYYSSFRRVSIEAETMLENRPDTITKNYLLAMQTKIDSRREIPFLPPNLLHKVCSKTLHALRRERNLIKDV